MNCSDSQAGLRSEATAPLKRSLVFRQVVGRIKRRMKGLNMDLEKHTLVFDRGCNSKKNLVLVARLKLHYVGALTPSQHVDLIEDAETRFASVDVDVRRLRGVGKE